MTSFGSSASEVNNDSEIDDVTQATDVDVLNKINNLFYS